MTKLELIDAIAKADEYLNIKGDPIAAHITLAEALRATEGTDEEAMTPAALAEVDAALAEWGAHRNEIVAKTIDFVDRVQEYARSVLRRDGTPGPLEIEADIVGALLRSEFASPDARASVR